MANNTQRLELTWIGKGQEPKLEPRILIEDKEKSYGDPNTGNMLVHGDNLLALKALENDFSGKVKCVFIDPPYNTGSAFEHYDDGLEHSQWLSLISPRLKILKNLLSTDGSIWITIDDNEAHYLKVLCDEIFGRRNFIANIVWEKTAGRKNDTYISSAHDHILAYASDLSIWKKTRNLLLRDEKQIARYQNPDNDPRGPWIQGADSTAKSGNDNLRYEVKLPSGRVVIPPKGNFWRFSKTSFQQALDEDRVYFGKDGDSLPIVKKFLSEVKDGVVPRTWWPSSEVNSNQGAKRDHLRKLLPDIIPFATPKPEQLLERIIHISTNPGEIVFDSFAGSGTTGATAQKMGRRWIMVELGDHCYTHILPRLRKVIDGEDQGGISKSVGWQGGGGFNFYELAPSLLKKDIFGNWIIDSVYKADMLAAAMAKHEGYHYCPDEQLFWKQGQSTEKDFIFTTTQFVTVELIDKINEQMQDGESLLICCKSFQEACESRFDSINIRKIPVILLGRCEFGKDDYSLNIINMPAEEDEEFSHQALPQIASNSRTEEFKQSSTQGKLF